MRVPEPEWALLGIGDVDEEDLIRDIEQGLKTMRLGSVGRVPAQPA